MDKRTLLTVAAFGLAILAWMFGLRWYADRQGWDLDARPAPPVVDEDAAVEDDVPEADLPPPQDDAAELPPVADAATRPAETGGLRVAEAGDPSAVVVLGSAEPEDETYALQLTLNPVGAGIERAVLNDFTQTTDHDARYEFETPYVADPNATRPLATRSVQLLGRTVSLYDVPWKLGDVGEQSATFYLDLVDAEGAAVMRIEKRFRIFARDEAIRGQAVNHGGFEIVVRERFVNPTGREIAVRTTIQGPTTPPRELETGIDRQIVRGELTGNGVRYAAEQVESFGPSYLKNEYLQSEAPLMWAGAGTTYFNAIVRPVNLGGDGEVAPPRYLDRVVAEAVNPEARSKDRRVALRFVTEPIVVPAGGDAAVPLAVFLGPKERSLLTDPYYASAGIGYDQTLRSPFGCTWCVFQPVVDVLVFLLATFEFVFRDWGLAIIALVCVVRLALHPITRRAQKNMMRLSKVAPKIEQIKKKYGEDREKMAQAMAEVAPEQASALLFGCLPMMLQTPIWIALYSTLQATFALRQAPFLYGWTWIDDLSQPDRLIDFGGPVVLVPDAFPLLPEIAITGINILPLLMAVVFYVNIKLQPTPTATMTEEQKKQQKLIQTVMVLAFPLFLYAAPSGLNLYILTSTAIGIVETKLIRRNLKREEEAQEAAEAEAKRTGKPLAKKEPKTAFGQRLASVRTEIGRRVEAAQREAQKQARAKSDKGRR